VFSGCSPNQITQGAADAVKDDDKRKHAVHNLLSSIPSAVNMEGDRNVDIRSLGEACQPDGIHGGTFCYISFIILVSIYATAWKIKKDII